MKILTLFALICLPLKLLAVDLDTDRTVECRALVASGSHLDAFTMQQRHQADGATTFTLNQRAYRFAATYSPALDSVSAEIASVATGVVTKADDQKITSHGYVIEIRNPSHPENTDLAIDCYYL